MESFKTIIGLAIIFLSQQACAEHMNQRESIPTPEEMEERGVAARASSIEKFNTYVEQDKAHLKKQGKRLAANRVSIVLMHTLKNRLAFSRYTRPVNTMWSRFTIGKNQTYRDSPAPIEYQGQIKEILKSEMIFWLRGQIEFYLRIWDRTTINTILQN